MTIKYNVLRKLADDEKMAPQARFIFKVIDGQKNPTRKSVIDVLKDAANKGDLVTRQPVERLLSYYQRDFIERGLIAVDKETAAENKEKGKKKAA